MRCHCQGALFRSLKLLLHAATHTVSCPALLYLTETCLAQNTNQDSADCHSLTYGLGHDTDGTHSIPEALDALYGRHWGPVFRGEQMAHGPVRGTAVAFIETYDPYLPQGREIKPLCRMLHHPWQSSK